MENFLDRLAIFITTAFGLFLGGSILCVIACALWSLGSDALYILSAVAGFAALAWSCYRVNSIDRR